MSAFWHTRHTRRERTHMHSHTHQRAHSTTHPSISPICLPDLSHTSIHNAYKHPHTHTQSTHTCTSWISGHDPCIRVARKLFTGTLIMRQTHISESTHHTDFQIISLLVCLHTIVSPHLCCRKFSRMRRLTSTCLRTPVWKQVKLHLCPNIFFLCVNPTQIFITDRENDFLLPQHHLVS